MWRCSVLLALALAPGLRAADKPDALRAEAAAALKRFYEERLGRPFLRDPDQPEKKPVPPPWEAPLKKLQSGNPDERADAAAFLRELLTQALEQETGGKAPWRSTPYWGGGADLPARDLRKEVAEALAEAAPLGASLPLIRWYLERERVPGHLGPVVRALGKLDGEQADALRAELGRILAQTPLWDGQVQAVQVTNLTPQTVEVRVLVSARDGGELWDLRRLVREKLLRRLQSRGAGPLPLQRVELLPHSNGESLPREGISEPVSTGAPRQGQT